MMTAPAAPRRPASSISPAIDRAGAAMTTSSGVKANSPMLPAAARLLHGVSAITATAGGGFNAMVSDLRALSERSQQREIDTSGVVFVMAPGQAVPLGLMAVPGTPSPQVKIIAAPGLAAGTVIAVATSALAVAGSGVPTIDIGKQPTLHLADTPRHIGVVGSPSVVAAPTISLYQTDQFALKCIARICWSAAPGAVQYISSATW